MTVDLKDIKRKIAADYQFAFPQLTLFSQIKLYKIIDCIAIGIELIQLPFTQEYRPYFVVYPLWKADIKTCFDAPIILKQYYNQKGLQFDIPYEKHLMFFGAALESIKQQTALSFEGNISLKNIYALIDSYSKTSPLNAAPHSYLQARLQQHKLEIALFKSITEARTVLAHIEKISWDANHFKACNVDIDNWLQTLNEEINHRSEFLEQIELNKQNKKILKLNKSIIIA